MSVQAVRPALLRVDQQAMQHRADRVVRGLTLAMEAAHAPQGVIATKLHYEEAVAALQEGVTRLVEAENGIVNGSHVR